MSYLGPSPSATPLTAAQMVAGDTRFGRIDGANEINAPFVNVIVNASFDNWQRGIGPATGYVADRFYTFNNGNGSLTTERIILPGGEAPTESRYAIRVKQTGRTTGVGILSTQIESVRRLAGKRVVMTALVRGTATASVGTYYLEQIFGSGGSAGVSTTLGSVNVTAQWTRQIIGIVNLPGILGKTVAASNYLAVSLYLNAGDIQFDMTDIELKELQPGFGDQVSPFQPVPAEIDLMRCQRFFQRVPGTALRGIASQVNIVNRFGGPYAVPMRVTPSLTIGGALYVYDGRNTSQITLSTSFGNNTCMDVDCGALSNLVQYAPVIGLAGGTIDANAEL